MLRRKHGLNRPFVGTPPRASVSIERQGHYLLKEEFNSGEIAELRSAVEDVFRIVPPDQRAARTSPENAAMFRYDMFNRSGTCQSAIGRLGILRVIEPLVGEDCHVLSCTAWRNPAGNEHAPRGSEWHTDGGPHVPRGRWSWWPLWIPYPIFVVATHIYLEDCSLDDGPTAILEGSHRSGRMPPGRRIWDVGLRYRGGRAVKHVAAAGDVGFFVSDAWHRRLPPARNSAGRFFLQTNYARRDISQRLRPSEEVNFTTPESRNRAKTDRERELIGIHPQSFYDS